MKRRNKWFKWIFTTVLALSFTILPAGLVNAQAEQLKPGTAYVVVDGVEKPIAEGMVVTKLITTVNEGVERYSLPYIKIMLVVNQSLPYASAELSINEQKEVVVSKVEFFKTMPPEFAQNPSSSPQKEDQSGFGLLDWVSHAGWAESNTKDYFELTVTWTKAELYYIDYGDSLYYTYDAHDSGSQTLINLWQWSTWDKINGNAWTGDPPTQMQAYTRATHGCFDVTDQTWYIHTEHTSFVATPGGIGVAQCEYWGDLPEPGWPLLTHIEIHGGFYY